MPVSRKLTRFTIVAATIGVVSLLPAAARAAPCDGFVDVDDTASYCSSASFLKSRGITLGCSDTSHYCPDANVTRAQMALFFDRLSNVVTPLLGSTTGYYLGGDLDPGYLYPYCAVSIPSAGYPRNLRLSGTWYGHASSGDVNVKLFYNPSGGGLFDVGGLAVPAPVGSDAPVTFASQLYLDSGTDYELVLGVANDGDAGTTIGDSSCALDTLVVNYVIPPGSADQVPSSSVNAPIRPTAVRAAR